MHSDAIKKGPDHAAARAMLRATGLSAEDIQKPEGGCNLRCTRKCSWSVAQAICDTAAAAAEGTAAEHAEELQSAEWFFLDAMVGQLYEFNNAVHPWLEGKATWVQTLSLSSEKLVSKFAFKWVNLYELLRHERDAVGRAGAHGVRRVSVEVRRESDASRGRGDRALPPPRPHRLANALSPLSLLSPSPKYPLLSACSALPSSPPPSFSPLGLLFLLSHLSLLSLSLLPSFSYTSK